MDEIKKAIRKGHQALSEFQSKKLLDSYGIPITREKLAESKDDAVSYAEDIGRSWTRIIILWMLLI